MEEIEDANPIQTDKMEEFEITSEDQIQTHRMEEIETAPPVEYDEMKQIEYECKIDNMEGVKFPEINTAEDMEGVLINFKVNEEDVRYNNLVAAQELYVEMFDDPLIERLQDGNHWSN